LPAADASAADVAAFVVAASASTAKSGATAAAGGAVSAAVAQSAAFADLLAVAAARTPTSTVVSAVIAGARASVVNNLGAAFAAAVDGAGFQSGSGSGTSAAAVVSSASAVLASISAAALADTSTPPVAALALATSIADAAAAVVSAASADGAALPPVAAADLLGALGDALASTAATAERAPPPPGFNESSMAALVAAAVPAGSRPVKGGSPLILVTAVAASLRTLTAAQLASMPIGEPQTVSTAPDAVLGGTYCGAAIINTALTVVASAPVAIELPQMNPCSSPSSLPPDVAAAQPPVSLTSAAAASLPSGSSVALTLFGQSPFDETAGLIDIAYAPLPSLSVLALAANTASAQALAASTTLRRLTARLLGASALDVVLAATGGTSATIAASVALEPSLPRVAFDLMPRRPLDSRVVAVRVSSAGGATVPLPPGTFAFNVTLPFRDLSIVKWDAVTQRATVDVGNSGFARSVLTVTCPSSPAAAAAGVVATYVSGGSGAASVRLESSASVAYTGVVGSVTTTGSGGAFGAVAAPDGASVSQDLLTLPVDGSRSAGETVGAALAARAPTVESAGYVCVLSVDCGPALGRQSFVCGAGLSVSTVTFSCPTVVAVPTCLRFNVSKGAWSPRGCAVAEMTATGATCTCDSPGAVAVRFAALSQAGINIFAEETAMAPTTTLGVSFAGVVLLGVAGGVFALGALLSGGDEAAARRWAASLSNDAELTALEAADVNRTSMHAPPLKSAVNVRSSGGVGATVYTRGRAASKSARVLPIGAPRAVTSHSVAIAALGTALETWAASHCVELSPQSTAAKGSAATELVASWRAAVARGVDTDSNVITGSRGGVPGLLRSRAGLAGAVIRARLLTGEPPAALLTLWGLRSTPRTGPLLDFRSAALATPRHTRLLGALAAFAISGAGVCILYAYLLVPPLLPGTPAFAALTVTQTLALALASALFVSAPLDAAILAALRWRARAAAAKRFPGLEAELARRKRASDFLGPLPTSALLRLAAAGGSEPLYALSVDESAALDAAAPPGFEAEPAPAPAVLAHAPALLTACGRHPSQRADAAAAATAVAEAAGLVEGSSTQDADALTSLRVAFDSAAPPRADTRAIARAAAAAALGTDAILLALAAFGSFYCVAFAHTRGRLATEAAVGAWALSAALAVFALHPASVAVRVVVAFGTRGVLRRRARAFRLWHDTIALPAAAAAAAGAATTADAAAALLPPELLAAAAAAFADATGENAAAAEAGAAAALRAAALVRAYLALVTPLPPAPRSPPSLADGVREREKAAPTRDDDPIGQRSEGARDVDSLEDLEPRPRSAPQPQTPLAHPATPRFAEPNGDFGGAEVLWQRRAVFAVENTAPEAQSAESGASPVADAVVLVPRNFVSASVQLDPSPPRAAAQAVAASAPTGIVLSRDLQTRPRGFQPLPRGLLPLPRGLSLLPRGLSRRPLATIGAAVLRPARPS
jgi:hypothetical protein